MDLHVILRTCLNSALETNKENVRICGNDREEMLVRCFLSLIESINLCDFKVKLTILDDNSHERFLFKLKNLITRCNHEVELINLPTKGFNDSAYIQFKLASESNSLVYTVEDDYLHSRESISKMYVAYHNLKSIGQVQEVVINPHDDPFRYQYESIEPCKIFIGDNRYWRTSRQTTNTFFTHSKFIKNHFDVYESLSKKYPNITEEQTINKLYNNLVDHGGPATVFSPIPSLAVHLSYCQEIQRSNDMLDWKDRWNEMELWKHVPGYFDYSNFYREIVQRSSSEKESVFVEVGSWLGRSTSCMATYIKNSQKNIKFYSIDTWKGSDELDHKEYIKSLEKTNSTLFDEYSKNVFTCGVMDYIIPIQSTSIEASSKFEDESIDFIHIDASHDYENVLMDISSWYPKVKKGGIISGDDYEPEVWDGVVKAVNDYFKDHKIYLIDKDNNNHNAKVWLVEKV